MRTQEEWRGITGWSERYQVSTDGQVKNIQTGRIKKWQEARNGYYRVSLYKDAEQKDNKYYIHRLVAEAFIPNPENKPEVNHKDNNKENNHYSNLEWVTHSENHIHLRSLGCLVGEGNGRAKFTKEDVLHIRSLQGQMSHGKIAKMYGVGKAAIQKIQNRTRWRHLP